MEVKDVFQFVDELVFPYRVESFPYIKETGHCSHLAINFEQDIGFKDKKDMFKGVTCSIGELGVWNCAQNN